MERGGLSPGGQTKVGSREVEEELGPKKRSLVLEIVGTDRLRREKKTHERWVNLASHRLDS